MKYVGHFDPRELPGAHRAMGGHLEGFTIAFMVDRALGAHHLVMFIVQFAPGGRCDAHDHPFEEAYFVLEGEVVLTLAGREHRLGPGDYAWSGVGTPHGFRNEGRVPVRWLEVQAPAPPPAGMIRFLD